MELFHPVNFHTGCRKKRLCNLNMWTTQSCNSLWICEIFNKEYLMHSVWWILISKLHTESSILWYKDIFNILKEEDNIAAFLLSNTKKMNQHTFLWCTASKTEMVTELTSDTAANVDSTVWFKTGRGANMPIFRLMVHISYTVLQGWQHNMSFLSGVSYRRTL